MQGGVCSVTADSILIPFRLFTGCLLSVRLMLITADRCQKDLHNRRPNVVGRKVDAGISRNFLISGSHWGCSILECDAVWSG